MADHILEMARLGLFCVIIVLLKNMAKIRLHVLNAASYF